MIVLIRFSFAKEDSGKGSPRPRRSHPGVSGGQDGAEKQKGYDKIEPHALLLHPVSSRLPWLFVAMATVSMRNKSYTRRSCCRLSQLNLA